MTITKNLWAPLNTGGKKPWIIWQYISYTKRDSKAAYLKDIPLAYRAELLACVKFIKVFVAEQKEQP